MLFLKFRNIVFGCSLLKLADAQQARQSGTKGTCKRQTVVLKLPCPNKPGCRLLIALGKMLTDRVRDKDFFSSHVKKFIEAEVQGFGRPGSEGDTLYQSDYEHAGPATCDDCDPALSSSEP